MKLSLIIIATLGTVSAFTVAPVHQASSTSLSAAKKEPASGKSVSRSIFDMDLWKERAAGGVGNEYGNRANKEKQFGWGKIGKVQEGSSYVPSGLTAAQYNDIRAKQKSKKDANYAKNVAKAGKFEDYTDFYLKRGTDTGGSWLKDVTRGHRMVKTKYDWDDVGGSVKNFASSGSAVSKAKARAQKKKAAAKPFWKK
ncbi:hypothetical protein TrLO_g1309 [Triparma laevis f. longispina]|uniref:Uncharacterized protein n=1 Tax=Triparma laevis f. longispina TaxID=1714387 RepID=A0A9W7KS13_9STRA|nr:hypothetical protein TrLO_g1309 [Triparma laevis f. longispina]